MKTSIVGLACTALLCSGAATAHADAIAVSDGLISTDFVRDVRVDLVSDLFTLNLVGSANTIQMPSAFGFFGGAAVNFSATVNGVFHTAPVPSTGQTVTLQVNVLVRAHSVLFILRQTRTCGESRVSFHARKYAAFDACPFRSDVQSERYCRRGSVRRWHVDGTRRERQPPQCVRS